MGRSARLLGVNWRYAAGEITIIVIGILIALAVDNCNEARGAARRESDYLVRVAADLRRDTAMFTFTDSLLDSKERALAAADSILNGNRMLRDTVAFLQALVSSSTLGWNQPKVRTITFQDLLSTGNLRLIRDLELRATIVQYYTSAESTYDRVRSRITGYSPLTYELLPREREFAFHRPEDGPALALLTRRVLASELKHLITAEQNFARFLRSSNAVLRQNALQLLSQIGSHRTFR